MPISIVQDMPNSPKYIETSVMYRSLSCHSTSMIQPAKSFDGAIFRFSFSPAHQMSNIILQWFLPINFRRTAIFKGFTFMIGMSHTHTHLNFCCCNSLKILLENAPMIHVQWEIFKPENFSPITKHDLQRESSSANNHRQGVKWEFYDTSNWAFERA